ncbi:adhesion G-protein coupled receptor G2 isoform X2 [Tiliqua scincoides]|uniref:adhesion G-protein coupled receptor G2 isoform X2 n=1 Tax=Tiliqua scincoides TaxID=71010 RepID=UPI0034621AFE
MITCGVHHSCADRAWEILLKCKISLSLLLLHLFLASSDRAQDGFWGQYRAVFNTACNDVWTLAPGISVPSLNNFTLCVYIKLYNTRNWTAFVYNKEDPNDNLPEGYRELGLAGGRDRLTIWIFGKEITVLEGLNNHTWHQVCIGWKGDNQEVTLYVDEEEKKREKIAGVGDLLANGQLLLGCSQRPGKPSSTPVGMVGELYMFRMWPKANRNYSQDCQDGTIIHWRRDNWTYNKTARFSITLPCANAVNVSSGGGKGPGTTSADSSIVTFVTYPNSATDSSSSETLGAEETTYATEPNFSPTTGMRAAKTVKNTEDSAISTSTNVVENKTQDNNVCNLSVFCNDSVFYMGTKRFQTDENSSDTSYNLTLQYPGNTFNNFQLTVPQSLPQRPNISAFNQTLQKLSESSAMQCGVENQSISDCTFIIKLEKDWNVSRILEDLHDVAEIGLIELCCCSTLRSSSCPSTVEELKLLQCGVHEAVACIGPSTFGPTAPLVVPSTISSTIVTQNGTPFSKLTTVSPSPLIQHTLDSQSIFGTHSTHTSLPFTEQNSSFLLSAPSVKTTNTEVSSFETTNTVFTTMSSSESTSASSPTEYSPIHITAVSHPTSLTKPTAAVSPAMPTTSSAMSTTSGMHSTTDEIGNPAIEKIVSDLERNLSAEEISPSLAGHMVNIVSELLDAPQSQISPMSKRIIKIVDAIGLKLNFSTESINLTSPSLALAVLKVNSGLLSSVSFSVKDTSDLQVTLGNKTSTNGFGTITLPSSILTNLPSEAMHQASRITFNFFEKTTLFQDPLLKNLSLISHVISSSVANITVNNLKTNVTIALQNAKPTQENLTVRCAFWNFTNNGGKGGWAYEGCVVKERTTNETVCSCNHLTSFGVLLDLSRNATVSPTQVLILTFITYIGCGLSAIFLSVTLVTYIAFEKIRRDYPSKILIQLCIALLLLNLVFLLDSWIALSNIRGLCISVAVFLHYFLLVSFTWMGLEAFHMYLALVKVFNTYVRKYILKFCFVGWGVPAIVVAIVLAINPDNYGLRSYGNFPNGSPDEFCWINNDVVFYITVVGYFCTIFLLNVSMFIVVLIQLCRIKKKKQLGAQRKTSIQDLRSVAGLTFLLGITWGFAFFAWGPINLIFMYLFAIFNTLQAKENVRKQWRRYLCCGKYRLAENSDWSRTATNGLKKQNVNQGVSSSSNSLQSNSNSTNSTSMLMNNDYSVHVNGNGNISSEKNGVSFNAHNGDVRLHDFSGKQLVFHENNDTGHKKPRVTLRRTSERGNLHFIEPM